MKDKKNILIIVLVLIILVILVPGFVGGIIKISWTLFKIIVIGLAILLIISYLLKKKKN